MPRDLSLLFPVSPGNITIVSTLGDDVVFELRHLPAEEPAALPPSSRARCRFRRHSRRCCCLEGVQHRRFLLHTPASSPPARPVPGRGLVRAEHPAPGRGLMPTPALACAFAGHHGSKWQPVQDGYLRETAPKGITNSHAFREATLDSNGRAFVTERRHEKIDRPAKSLKIECDFFRIFDRICDRRTMTFLHVMIFLPFDACMIVNLVRN